MINLLMTPSKRNWKTFNTAALIITGAIRDNSRERKLVFLYKTVKGLAPSYLQSYLLPDNERTCNTKFTVQV